MHISQVGWRCPIVPQCFEHTAVQSVLLSHNSLPTPSAITPYNGRRNGVNHRRVPKPMRFVLPTRPAVVLVGAYHKALVHRAEKSNIQLAHHKTHYCYIFVGKSIDSYVLA